MPNLTGIEVVEKLRSQNNLVKIVMLSMHESEEYVLKSIRAGADGYLLKGSSKEEFLKAVHTVANGGKYFSGDISSILIGQLSNPVAAMETKQSLDEDMMITKREKEILKLLLSGKGNKEIAEALDISKRTAEVHRFNLMKKLKVKNLMELSNKANEFSLI
jgi:DNA-binding NarL/FixJ family response regulator